MTDDTVLGTQGGQTPTMFVPPMMMQPVMTVPSMAGATAGQGGTGGAAGAPMVMMTTPPPPPPPPPDGDSDGTPDETDNCTQLANADQVDADDDGAGDACDNCPSVANPSQSDIDDDDKGDACECEKPIVPCESGMAGPYACSGVDMLSRVALTELGGRSGNAVWGYADESGREIAVVGLDNGTAFVEVTYPACPVVLGMLAASGASSGTHDVKVFGHYALAVAESRNHGMQVFDLKTLLADDVPATLEEATVFRGTSAQPVGNAHDIVVDQESGFVYLVGTASCSGGLYALDMADPEAPKFAGCFSQSGYIHDAQCTRYIGPDTAHQGKELCLTANGENGFSIVDMTNKQSPTRIAHVSYQGSEYSHNGWLTTDHKYFLLGDELDEMRSGQNTRTFIFDVSDLDAPKQVGIYTAEHASTDHNLFIRGNRVFEANYTSGLRVLDLAEVAQGELTEVAFFDSYPSNDRNSFAGAWTAFPFLPSGNILMNDIQSGLFVLRLQAEGDGEADEPAQ